MSISRNKLELHRSPRALKLVLTVLFVAPVALAQAPAESPAQGRAQTQTTPAKSPAAGSAQSAAQTQAGAPAPVEPQMQDQSAPAAESLGDAARKARTQKTKAAAPKVYTEDSVSKLSGHGVSVVGDGSAGGGGTVSGMENSYANAPANSDAPAAGGSQEQMWRSKARAIRDQMAQLDQQISGIRDEIAKYGAVQVDPQSGAQAGVIYINDRNAEIAKIEERKTALQGQMDALEEEGRKAGADSGWFR